MATVSEGRNSCQRRSLFSELLHCQEDSADMFDGPQSLTDESRSTHTITEDTLTPNSQHPQQVPNASKFVKLALEAAFYI